MITLHGMHLSGGPHPLLLCTSKDQRVWNCPVHWLLNQIQQTWTSLPLRHEGSSTGISNIQLICVHITRALLWVCTQIFTSVVKTPRARTDTDLTIEVLVSHNSQTCFASFIKSHGCHLHLQLFSPAHSAVGSYILQYAHLHSKNKVAPKFRVKHALTWYTPPGTNYISTKQFSKKLQKCSSCDKVWDVWMNVCGFKLVWIKCCLFFNVVCFPHFSVQQLAEVGELLRFIYFASALNKLSNVQFIK